MYTYPHTSIGGVDKSAWRKKISTTHTHTDWLGVWFTNAALQEASLGSEHPGVCPHSLCHCQHHGTLGATSPLTKEDVTSKSHASALSWCYFMENTVKQEFDRFCMGWVSCGFFVDLLLCGMMWSSFGSVNSLRSTSRRWNHLTLWPLSCSRSAILELSIILPWQMGQMGLKTPNTQNTHNTQLPVLLFTFSVTKGHRSGRSSFLDKPNRLAPLRCAGSHQSLLCPFSKHWQ